MSHRLLLAAAWALQMQCKRSQQHRRLLAQWPFSELTSVASSFTSSLVGSDVVASDLARAMAPQLAVSASDIQIAVMVLAALLAAMLSELEAAVLADKAIDDVSGISAETDVLPIHAIAEGQPSVTGEWPDYLNVMLSCCSYL